MMIAESVLQSLGEQLAARAASLDQPRGAGQYSWPSEQLGWIAQAGILRGFEPVEHGGAGWSEAEQLRVYATLAGQCLTTAFVLTQYHGAIRRLLSYSTGARRTEYATQLLTGDRFATVAISHLTTSRRHLGRPARTAEPTRKGWFLSGTAPWVTGAAHADWIVTAAEQPDGGQVLLAVPCSAAGLQVQPAEELLALGASATGAVEYHDVEISREFLLAGPAPNVMSLGAAKTGGLSTSALAIGHAAGAIAGLQRFAEQRGELQPIADELHNERLTIEREMFSLARGETGCGPTELRARANSLALRATQSELAAAKGTGYVAGHPAGRRAREALFFLVWSCPPAVLNSNLCEFAGLE